MQKPSIDTSSHEAFHLVPRDLPCKTLASRALPDPDTSRKTTTPTTLRQQGGQARKHRYSNLSLIRKNNCSLRATQSLTASTNTRSKRAQNRLTPPNSSLAWTPHSEASAKHKGQPDLPEAEAAKSPSRSPKGCKPTQWRQLTHKEILRGKQHPKTQHRWTARKTHDDQEPRTCRSATNQSQHAHAEAPTLHLSSGTSLLFKVRMLKASTKNPGLSLTPPHGHIPQIGLRDRQAGIRSLCSRHRCFHYQSNVFRNGFNLKATTQVTDARYVC